MTMYPPHVAIAYDIQETISHCYIYRINGACVPEQAQDGKPGTVFAAMRAR